MIRRIIILAVFVFACQTSKAQPGDPNGGDKPGTPITGIEILIGLGSLFGAKKLFTSKKKEG